jgi:hypothetical protein
VNEIKETWEFQQNRRDVVVLLSGAEVEAFNGNEHPSGKILWRRYQVSAVGIHLRWPVGSDEGTIRVSLQCWGGDSKIPRYRAIFKNPGSLREIPAWLLDLVTRATPRDIDYPDIEPYSANRGRAL